MSSVIAALASALRDLREPRVLALGLLPPLAAMLVWAGLAWAFAGDWSRLVADWIATTNWLSWLRDWGLSSVFIWASGIAAIALLLPVMLITAVLVTELVAMPVIVQLVGERNYPHLERRMGGTIVGSLWNATAAVVMFVVLWLVTLPLWLTGFGAFVLPALNSAYLNQRLFRYDALAEHASREEYEELVRRTKGRLYLLGLLLASLYYVPFVNLVAPVFSGLAFTHFCLGELATHRADPRRAQ